MDSIKTNSFYLAGVRLKEKTSNVNGQSLIDCGKLWEEFFQKGIAGMIHGKLDNDIYAVYYDYDGDYTNPYSYFIGCKIDSKDEAPEGLVKLAVPELNCMKFVAKGEIHKSLSIAWENIWKSHIPRAYDFDFEVYGEKSVNPKDAEIDIYISLK